MPKQTNMHMREMIDMVNSMESSTTATVAVTKQHGTNIVESAQNLFEHIDQNYSPEEAADLKRKLMNAIRDSDSGKFTRAVERIHDR